MSGKLGTLTLDSGASSAATLTTVVCCARGVSRVRVRPGRRPGAGRVALFTLSLGASSHGLCV